MPKETRIYIDTNQFLKGQFWHFSCETCREFDYKLPTDKKLSFKGRFEYNPLTILSSKTTGNECPKVIFIQWKKFIPTQVIGYIEYNIPVTQSKIMKFWGKPNLKLFLIPEKQSRTHKNEYCSIEREIRPRCLLCQRYSKSGCDCEKKCLYCHGNHLKSDCSITMEKEREILRIDSYFL